MEGRREGEKMGERGGGRERKRERGEEGRITRAYGGVTERTHKHKGGLFL